MSRGFKIAFLAVLVLGFALFLYVRNRNAPPRWPNLWPGQKYVPGSMEPAEAILIASQLSYDMREEDAGDFLAQKGLRLHRGTGDSFGWGDGCGLTNKFLLGLDITRGKFHADGAWADGLVKAASIQSNGIDVFTIPLRNAPLVPNAIDQLVTNLSATHGMWRNGLTNVIKLPATASPEELIQKCFEMGSINGQLPRYHIIMLRQVHIPSDGMESDLCTAAQIYLDIGQDIFQKIVILKYMGGGWWTRNHDAKLTP
jgi:hypothetical protein